MARFCSDLGETVGAPVRDGDRLGMPVKGSETLRIVPDLCGFRGTVGDVNRSVARLRDKVRLAGGCCDGPSRWLSRTEGLRVTLVGMGVESYRQTAAVNI